MYRYALFYMSLSTYCHLPPSPQIPYMYLYMYVDMSGLVDAYNRFTVLI